MTADHRLTQESQLRAVAVVAVDQLRLLVEMHDEQVGQLLQPMIVRAEQLAARDSIGGEDLAQLLADLEYARTLLTGGVIT